jgi:hypothetical protein
VRRKRRPVHIYSFTFVWSGYVTYAMTKYAPLQGLLARSTASEFPMTFAEIESVIGASLPPAAYRHRAWWSNNPTNKVMTRAWLDAGYRTERVDMAGRRVLFRRARPLVRAKGAPPGVIDTLRRELGATLTIAAGVDLTEPAEDGIERSRDADPSLGVGGPAAGGADKDRPG